MSRATAIAVWAIGLVFLGLAGAGCGGGGDSFTRADFVEQGDAICANAESEKDVALEKAFAEQSELWQPGGPLSQGQILKRVALPPIETMTDELRALGTPSGDGGKAAAIIRALEKEIREVASDPAAAAAAGDLFAGANRLARAYGMKACAEI